LKSRVSAFQAPTRPTSHHLGKAGEFFVAGQLLRLGYNCSPLPVDTGVALLAHWLHESGESRVALVQVKTTEKRRSTVKLKKRQLEKMVEMGVNLIVVFWSDPQAPFALVVPPALLYMLTSGGFQDPKAPIRAKGEIYWIVFVEKEPQAVYVRNRFNDVSCMVNRFDRLAPTDEDHMMIPPYAEWSNGKHQLLKVLSDDEM